MALRRQLEVIANRHRALVKACHERLDSMSDEQLRWAPDDKTWSIVLIVDHLIKVHAGTSPVFMKALQEAGPAGDDIDKEVRYSFADNLMVQWLSPGSKFKLPVPKQYRPTTHSATPHAVVNRLYEEFEAFSVILEYANDKKLKGVKVHSPAGGGSRSVVAFFDATVQHNRFHFLQIEALSRDPKFPR